MTISEKLAYKMTLIADELASIEKSKFTGEVTFTLNCSEGGIGRMSMVMKRNLLESKNKKS